MRKMKKLEKGDLTIYEKDEFQSFIARPCYRSQGKLLYIAIPKEIREYLQLKAGELIEIAIRKVTEEYALTNYGGLPRAIKRKSPYRRMKYVHDTKKYKQPPPKNKVLCPVCGKYGSPILRKSQGKYIVLAVRHFKWDGFKQPTEHSISKKRYPNFWKEIVSLLKKNEGD